MSGIYDVTIAPGAAAYVGAIGGYVKVISAPQGAVQVKLDGGEAYSLLEGQGFRLPDGSCFRDVQVKNLASVSQSVSLFIGDARFEDSRITGTVRIIDSSTDKTLLGKQFLGSDAAPASGAAFPLVSLLANGGNLAVRGLHISSPVAGSILLATLTGAGTIAALTNPVPNKVAGGAGSTARSSGGNTAAATPTVGEAPGFSGVARFYLAANADLYLPFTNPLIFTGNRGLAIAGSVVNRDLTVAFEFEEYV